MRLINMRIWKNLIITDNGEDELFLCSEWMPMLKDEGLMRLMPMNGKFQWPERDTYRNER